MRVLAQRRLRATFFLVGKQALLYPHLVRDLVNAGHEIGSHSHTHQNMAELSALDVERELVESRWAIARACGRRVILFRPPGGHYSDIMRNAVAAYGFRPVFWTANISRYAKRPYAEVIAGLMEDLRDGGILLLHNGDDETPYIIEELLNRLLAAGHRIGPIGELSGMPQPYFATGGSLGR
jgi:peptidoglycan/xylan/chitin deacetylase (PgdA/CDA1 family)